MLTVHSVGMWAARTADCKTLYRFLNVHLLLLTKKLIKLQSAMTAILAVGDTVVTLTSGNGISESDIINFVMSMNIE